MKKPPFTLPEPEDGDGDINRRLDDLYGALGIQREEIDRYIAEVQSQIAKPGLRGGFNVDDVRSFGTIQNAVNAVPSASSKTIFITNTQTIAANLTIPSNITLVPLRGGSVDIATGVTLTLPLPDAGRFRWITWAGTGRVRFTKGAGQVVKPEWWGATPEASNGTTDSAAAIQAALEAARAAEVELNFGYGTYHISSGLTVVDDGAPIYWRGQGKYYTYIMATLGSSFSVMLSLTDTDNAVTALTYTNYAARSHIEGLSFDGGGVHTASTGVISTASRAQYGIKGITNHLTLRSLRVKGTGTAGLDIGCGWDNYYDDVETSTNQGDGIRANRCANNNGLGFNHVSSFSNIGYGIRLKDGVGIDIYGGGALELNLKGAIFLEVNVDAYSIHGMYFESNGGGGHVWDMPYLVGAGANATYLSGITASTVQTQGQGALTNTANVIGTCANANDVVTLPAAAADLVCYVENDGAQTLQVYPASGDQINALAVDASITIAAGSHLTFRASNGTNWTSDALAMAAERTTKADIIINGSTQPTEISNALPCGGVITGNSVSPGAAEYFVYGPGQRGLVLEGNVLNSGGEAALFGTYGNHSPVSPENSYASVNNVRIGVNPGWGTSVAPYFDIRPLGYEIHKVAAFNAFVSGSSQVNAVPTDMGAWVLTGTEDGGTFARSTEVFPYDPTAEVYEIALGTTGTSNLYGIGGIDAADFEQLQGKFVVASIWMKHTGIADVSGILRASNSVFSVRQAEMSFGASVEWERITFLYLFPTSGTVYFDVGKIEQGSGNIGTIYFTAPVICEYGADFQQIEYRTSKKRIASGQVWGKTSDTTVANTVTETSILGTGTGLKSIPSYWPAVGRSALIRFSGYFSTTGTPNLRFRAKIGGVTVGDTGAIATASGVANGLFTYECRVSLRTIGASGTLYAQMLGWNGTVQAPAPNTGTDSIDTTADQAVDVTAEWGTADAANTLTCTNAQIVLEG